MAVTHAGKPSAEPLADRGLLERFRRGEKAALVEVFRAYAPRVAASVRRGVRLAREGQMFVFTGPSTEVEVERVVQEAFSRAFTPAARQRYDGVTPYGAYVCRVARNLLIDEAEQRRRSGDVTADGTLPELESLEPGAHEVAEHGELRALVSAFLGDRPPLEREVYQLRFRDSLTQDEAAARMGAARITVRRAEARLKEAFVRFLARRGVLSTYAPASPPLRGEPRSTARANPGSVPPAAEKP